MKKYNLTWIIFLVFLLIVTLSACSETKENLIYTNDEYGFSIEFPESWSGEFEVIPYEYGLAITSQVNDIETLAYIHKYTIQEWQDLNYGLEIPVQHQVLGENEEVVFILIYPGDVNYNIENEDSVKRNEEMTTDLMEENFIFNWLD
ncbi:hypothetical protein KQI41_10865 [Tissierella pigra]|uniref:hypothetical protein n=1 Tax=Tissierella pigra TaxID=2607614 RepID=UPI001C11D8B7|nr:hypothetical protein [Tissierella pigra]MBU5426912.1 hypothetical protein [Tissierella pigra]